jgi:hypothetical protein
MGQGDPMPSESWRLRAKGVLLRQAAKARTLFPPRPRHEKEPAPSVKCDLLFVKEGAARTIIIRAFAGPPFRARNGGLSKLSP